MSIRSKPLHDFPSFHRQIEFEALMRIGSATRSRNQLNSRWIWHGFRRRRHQRDRLTYTHGGTPTIRDRQAKGQRAQAVADLERAKKNLPVPETREGYIQYFSTNRRATRVMSPSILSVHTAREDFLGLIYNHRWLTFVENPGVSRPFSAIVIDLEETRELTLDAALVLTSEYHSACLSSNSKTSSYRPMIDDRGWQPNVRSLLKTLGFYELVDAGGRTSDISDPQIGSLRFVPFVSEEEVTGQRADELLEALRNAAGQAPKREEAYSALVEAIGNVRGHAYPADAPPVIGPVCHRWWAAGAYDPILGVLQFAVYDRGVGIACTLPKQPFFSSILRLTAPERTDADVIAGAIRYGRSRHATERRKGNRIPQGRGNGLWTICQIVEELEGSYVRITSGRGSVEYHGKRDVRKKKYSNTFCGTLVEWTLKLPPEPPNPG